MMLVLNDESNTQIAYVPLTIFLSQLVRALSLKTIDETLEGLLASINESTFSYKILIDHVIAYMSVLLTDEFGNDGPMYAKRLDLQNRNLQAIFQDYSGVTQGNHEQALANHQWAYISTVLGVDFFTASRFTCDDLVVVDSFSMRVCELSLSPTRGFSNSLLKSLEKINGTDMIRQDIPYDLKDEHGFSATSCRSTVSAISDLFPFSTDNLSYVNKVGGLLTYDDGLTLPEETHIY